MRAPDQRGEVPFEELLEGVDDPRQRARLVQRREVGEPVQLRGDARIDPDGVPEPLAPLHDAMADCEVLIVGAGPTGLVLAIILTRLGVRVRIVDKLTEPATAVVGPA